MSDIIIYPAYLDAEKSRSEGRRVPKEIAIENPKTIEIAKSIKQIGYKVDLEGEKRYPRSWWEKGRVKVKDTEEPKTEIMKAACAYIEAMRD